MNIEHFKALVIEIENLYHREFMTLRKQVTTTSGSKTWHRYDEQAKAIRADRDKLWKEIEEAVVNGC